MVRVGAVHYAIGSAVEDLRHVTAGCGQPVEQRRYVGDDEEVVLS